MQELDEEVSRWRRRLPPSPGRSSEPRGDRRGRLVGTLIDDARTLNTLAQLLELPIRHHGITLGEVTDVLLGNNAEPIGVAVRSIAGDPAFLPWPSAAPCDGEVLVTNPLAVLTQPELSYYRASIRSLAELLRNADGEPVTTRD